MHRILDIGPCIARCLQTFLSRPGIHSEQFDELANRWLPILDAFDEAGVNLCYEIHPGEDLHDGITFEMLQEGKL